MTIAIHKFVVSSRGDSVSIPMGATLLDAQEQNGCLVLWALVDPKEACGSYRTAVVLTGEMVDDTRLTGLLYFRTVQCGQFVLHLFMDERLRRAS